MSTSFVYTIEHHYSADEQQTSEDNSQDEQYESHSVKESGTLVGVQSVLELWMFV